MMRIAGWHSRSHATMRKVSVDLRTLSRYGLVLGHAERATNPR